jgi:hypothetical protein
MSVKMKIKRLQRRKILKKCRHLPSKPSSKKTSIEDKYTRESVLCFPIIRQVDDYSLIDEHDDIKVWIKTFNVFVRIERCNFYGEWYIEREYFAK